MRKINKTGPGTTRKSESVLEPEPEPPGNLSQFWNRTRNRHIIWVSSRTGTGTVRNMDPLQQCLELGMPWTPAAGHLAMRGLPRATSFGIHQTVSESTTSDETTSTTHFPVQFVPIFQIFFWNFFWPFFCSGLLFDRKGPPLWWNFFLNISKCCFW